MPSPARGPHCPSSPATPGGPCSPALCPVRAHIGLPPTCPVPISIRGPLSSISPCPVLRPLSLCLLSPCPSVFYSLFLCLPFLPVPLCFPLTATPGPLAALCPSSPPSVSPSLLCPFVPLPVLSFPPSSAPPSSLPVSLFRSLCPLCLSLALFKLQVCLLCPYSPCLVPLLTDSRLIVWGLRQHRALVVTRRGGQKGEECC